MKFCLASPSEGIYRNLLRTLECMEWEGWKGRRRGTERGRAFSLLSYYTNYNYLYWILFWNTNFGEKQNIPQKKDGGPPPSFYT